MSVPSGELAQGQSGRVAAPGRFLGFDYGEKRVGLALSDPSGSIASPLETYQRRRPGDDAEHFRRVIDQHNIVRLVVGLPVHTSGREGTKAREARRFGGWLANVTGLPVVFWDERFTTVEAERYLQQAELTAKKRKARRDMLAAQILLQSYLDAGAPASDQAARSAAALDDPAN